MPLYYITGVSASGKSTLRKALAARGYEAHDTDEDGITQWQNKQTGEFTERPDNPEERTEAWYARHDWNMSRQRVEDLATKAKDKPVFLCGITSNERDLYDLFAKVFCLTISEATLKRRLQERTDNDFGKAPAELANILSYHEWHEETAQKMGAVMLDAELPVEEILKKIEEMLNEESLGQSPHRSIVRIGNTVHRPASWWTPSVHHLLRYLESVGFAYSPRVVGFDEHGREVLTYLEGESGKEGWQHITNDEGLASFAKLLREYHDAVADYVPPKNAQWAYSPRDLAPGEIICHGDFGPWNIAWQDGKPVGILDWDFVLPAKPEYDVFYALQYAVPFKNDEDAIKEHHFKEVPDRKHRIEVFLKAYGIELENIVAGVADVQRQDIPHVQYLADKGMQPQVDWVRDGYLQELEERARWTEANRNLFE